MDAFEVLGFVHAAIYGRILLARRRATGALVAIKTMSRAHMAARRAVDGQRVQEDGLAELETLRLLSRVDGRDGHGSGADSSNDAVNSNDATAAAAASRLDRQFVLTLLEDFADWRTDSHCLVFDYCARGELFAQVARDGALPLDAARCSFAQVARALRFVHSRGVAHRDLSLENVLLDAAGRCRIADFGLATASGRRCAGRVGKAFYMAPEVLACSPADVYDGQRADMWSLGVLLFVLTTGVPPFERASDADPRFRAVRAKGVQELLRTWRLYDTLPPAVRELLGELLVADSAGRATIYQVCNRPWVADADVLGEEEASAVDSVTSGISEPGATGWDPQKELGVEAADPPKGSRHESTTAEAESASRSPPLARRKRIKVVEESCEHSAAEPATPQSVTGAECVEVGGLAETAAAKDDWVQAAARTAPSDPRASPTAWPTKSKAVATPRCLDFSGDLLRSAASTAAATPLGSQASENESAPPAPS